MEKVKNKFTFHFLPYEFTVGGFLVQYSPADCDQSRTQFESPSATGKRPHPKLHFHSIFSSFHPYFRSLQGDFKILGPRHWRGIPARDRANGGFLTRRPRH